MIGAYMPLEQSVECNDSAIRRLKCFILCVIWVGMLHFSPLLHVTRQRFDNLLACFTFHCLSANKTDAMLMPSGCDWVACKENVSQGKAYVRWLMCV